MYVQTRDACLNLYAFTAAHWCARAPPTALWSICGHSQAFGTVIIVISFWENSGKLDTHWEGLLMCVYILSPQWWSVIPSCLAWASATHKHSGASSAPQYLDIWGWWWRGRGGGQSWSVMVSIPLESHQRREVCTDWLQSIKEGWYLTQNLFKTCLVLLWISCQILTTAKYVTKYFLSIIQTKGVSLN